jgi:hypothetical protein
LEGKIKLLFLLSSGYWLLVVYSFHWFNLVLQVTMHIILLVLVAARESDIASTGRGTAGTTTLSTDVPGEQYQIGG